MIVAPGNIEKFSNMAQKMNLAGRIILKVEP